MAYSTTAAETIARSARDPDPVCPSKVSLHTFVVSWFGKHRNAEQIVRAVSSTSDYVSVVYSDPDSKSPPQFSCPSIRRSNDLYFGDKFRACIDSCDADIMLLIHADCSCDNWSTIPEHCRRAVGEIPNIGVWVPLIDFNYWGPDRTEIDRIPNSPFSIVAHTDAIVVGLTRRIVARMRKANLERNVYGWGIDPMFNYYTYSIGNIAVVDNSVFVRHPVATDYSWDVATTQQAEFLKQLTRAERTQSHLLDAVVRVRNAIKEAGSEDSTSLAVAERELALLSQRILRADKHVKSRALTCAAESARLWIANLRGKG